MNISENDKSKLQAIGVQLNGNLLIVNDERSSPILELKIEDVAQLIIKKSRKISKKMHEVNFHTLVICRWDLSKVKICRQVSDVKGLKGVLKRINMFFYTES